MDKTARAAMNITCLGIESSCDETAASVVEGGRTVLSNVIASQIDLHREYGGVVPEIASRLHLEAIIPVIDKALSDAGKSLNDIDLVAVTNAPGLIGALLVGVSAAKGIAMASGIPLIGVNHIEGHIMANLIGNPELNPPFISLVVSGGHSHIILVKEDFTFDIIARTRDDAAGEAFDKVARESGLGYPGGPVIDKTAKGGNPKAIQFPQTRFSDGSLDFSFSGVKTAALNYLNNFRMKASIAGTSVGNEINYPDFAASFQNAIIDVLSNNTIEAARLYGINTVCLAGGVSANSALREMMIKKSDEAKIKLYIPQPIYCTDNAAMIACAGTYLYSRGYEDSSSLNAYASLAVDHRN